jgi:beta-lactam-binding protein with PASTA domain
MIAAMLSVVAATAGAQTTEPSGQITVVNGMARDVVATAVPEDGPPIDLGGTLAPGDTGDPTILPPGTYEVQFFDGNSIPARYMLTLRAVEAWNIVAREGDPDAAAYPIEFDSSTPVATVANSSAGDVTATPPGIGIAETVLESLPTADPFTLESSVGSSVDVTPSTGDDAYTMVVAVGPIDDLGAVNVTIANLAQLRDDLAGSEPPPTTVPPTTIPPVTEVEVPDVVGETEADATSAISNAGLVTGSSEEPNDEVELGTVISQDPATGTEVAEGSTVNIVVSTGPEPPAIVPVPDVVGEDVAEATETLEAEGFVVEIAEEESDTIEADIVIDSNPSAGTEVAEGTTVVLSVSTGPGDVVVPDFSGMTISEATAAAEDVGLTITFVEDPNKPDPGGIVVSQNPEDGATVEAGTEVVAQLSPAFDDAWTILVVDENRALTVTGINFKFNTSTTSTVVDTTISQTAGVGQSGSWTTKIDISGLDDSEHFLRVTGTAEDGSGYEQMFKIPASGESTDQGENAASDSDGLPWWGWLIIGLLIIAVIAIGIKVFGGSGDDDGQTPHADTAPPPAPAAPPPPTDG